MPLGRLLVEFGSAGKDESMMGAFDPFAVGVGARIVECSNQSVVVCTIDVIIILSCHDQDLASHLGSARVR